MTKLLWHSNSPWAATGYGTQSALFAPRLRDAGYDIGISAFYGLDGGRLRWDGITVYPGHGTSYGNETIEGHANAHFDGDPRGGTVMTLMDVWVLNPELWRQFNVASWCPVDHDPLPPMVHQFFTQTGAIPIAMSRFGERLLEHFDPLYCPHGCDTKVFRPYEDVREKVGLPKDAFVVGVVAANKGQPPRKSFPEILQAFAAIRQRHDDAILYLHTEITGKHDGVSIPLLLNSLGVPREAVRFADQYRVMFDPLPAKLMAAVYSTFDVLLSPSRGEGFGIPVLEAQACGVPAIVSDFSAMSEVCGVGWKCEADPEWTGQQSWQVRPRLEEIVESLEHAYRLPAATRNEMSRDARKHAEGYDADRVFEEFMVPALDAAQERFAEKARRRDPAAHIQRGPSISVVTPWFNHPELTAGYREAVDGENATVIVVDNGSDPPVDRAAVRLEDNCGFSHACNVGLERADADAVLFLNNDIVLREHGWLEAVRVALKPGVLVGAQLRDDKHGNVDGQPLPYLDGWCLAGMRDDLLELDGWDEGYEEPSYYGDNDLCWRASQAGMELVQVSVGLTHLGNATSGEWDVSGVTLRNYERYATRVREAEQVAA